MTTPTGREPAPPDRPLRSPRHGAAEGAELVVTDSGPGGRLDGERLDGEEPKVEELDAEEPSGEELDVDRAPTRPSRSDAAAPARDRTPVLVLLSADWAGPSRPAPTLLRELSRRWGTAMHTLLIEEPDDEILARWAVEHLPTWLRFVPDEDEAIVDHGDEKPDLPRIEDRAAAAAQLEDVDGISTREHSDDAADGDAPVAVGAASSRPDEQEVLREVTLRGHAPGGGELMLPGPWRLSHRRSGALPKHVVEAELGPTVG